MGELKRTQEEYSKIKKLKKEILKQIIDVNKKFHEESKDCKYFHKSTVLSYLTILLDKKEGLSDEDWRNLEGIFILYPLYHKGRTNNNTENLISEFYKIFGKTYKKLDAGTSLKKSKPNDGLAAFSLEFNKIWRTKTSNFSMERWAYFDELKTLYNKFLKKTETYKSDTQELEIKNIAELKDSHFEAESQPENISEEEQMIPCFLGIENTDSQDSPIQKEDVSKGQILPTIIVGDGIAGSLSALGAAKKGNAVILLSEYDAPSRTNRVFLNKASKDQLLKYKDENDPLDTIFFEKLNRNRHLPILEGTTTSIRSIEKFLHRKIKQFPNILVLKNDKDAQSQNKYPLKINPDNKKIALTKNLEIPFAHLVDASGSKRAIHKKNPDLFEEISHDLLEKTVNKEKHIYPMLNNPANGTAVFHLKKLIPEEKEKPLLKKRSKNLFTLEFDQKDLEDLKRFGWKHNFPPKIYLITDQTKEKIYAGGDIPSDYMKLSNLDRIEETQKWFKYMITNRFKEVSENQLYIKGWEADGKEENDRVKKYTNKQGQYQLSENQARNLSRKKASLSIGTFDITLSSLENPIKVFRNDSSGNSVCVALGDAARSAHFHYAHGANDAISDAISFVECLPNIESGGKRSAFDIDKFEKLADKQSAQYDALLSKIKETENKKTLLNSKDAFFPAEQRSDKRGNKENIPLPVVLSFSGRVGWL